MRAACVLLGTSWALQPQVRRPRRRAVIRRISERQIPAYVETMKLYESQTGAETLPACGSATVKCVEHDGSHLVSHSEAPLFSREETQAIIDEAEERAERMGGWTTQRHANYATTDVPVQELPRTHEWFREKALPEVLYPFLATSYKDILPSTKALKVVDAFVVKYNATAGQSFLKPHRDGSVVSFNIALNDMSEYEGGGTWIARLVKDSDTGSIRSDRGHVLAHASGMLHGGHEVEAGVRYILVCFVILQSFANFATRFYQAVRDEDPPELEPMPPGIVLEALEGVDVA